MAIPPVDGLRTPQQVQRQREYARLALRQSAERSGAPLEGWTQDADGRPLPNDGWYWSISHKRQWAAGVVSRTPVGIDIEHVIPRRDEALFDVIADAEEWAIVGGRSWENFYRIWTAKEAVLKANGFGIGKLGNCRIRHVASLGRMDVEFPPQEFVVQHFQFDDHLGALTPGHLIPQWGRVHDATMLKKRSIWFREEPVVFPVRRFPRAWGWLLPELGMFDDPSEAQLALREAIKAPYRSLRFWFFLFAYALWVGAFSRWLTRLVQPLSVAWELLPLFVNGFVAGLGVLVAMLLPCRAQVRRRLRVRLNACGRAICIPCGYDLRGQTNTRCPECGTAF